MGYAGLRHVESDFQHGLLENEAVLAALDRIGLGPDQFGAETGERAAAVQLHGSVERRLSAKCRENRVGLFAFDDFFDDRRRDGLDVCAVRKLRIRHDRGRVRIDQNHFVSFFLQRLAGLHPGIVELAPLPDHDGTGSNDENLVQGRVFGHGG